jgi:hypothetical protein
MLVNHVFLITTNAGNEIHSNSSDTVQGSGPSDGFDVNIDGIGSAPECQLLQDVITFSGIPGSRSPVAYKMQQKAENFWYGIEQIVGGASILGGTASLYITSYPSSPGICFLSGRFDSVQLRLTVTLKTSLTGAFVASIVRAEDLQPEVMVPISTVQDQAAFENAADGADTDVDLLIAVTREAVCAAAGLLFPCAITQQTLLPIRTTVSLLMDELNNVVLDNSKFEFRVNQVGDLYITNEYTENVGVNWIVRALFSILDPHDGVLDDLYLERERVNADLAALIMSAPDSSGDGTLYGIASPGWGRNPSQFSFITNMSPFSITQFSFSHEFGHMMVSPDCRNNVINTQHHPDHIDNSLQGARHENDFSNPPARGFYSPTGPVVPYSTIMTRLDTCNPTLCTRLPVFSSADMLLSGLVIGAPDTDNRQEVKANIANVANYRASGSRYVKHILWVFSGVNFHSYLFISLLVQDGSSKNVHDRL